VHNLKETDMNRLKLITAAALGLMLAAPSFAVDIIQMHKQLTEQAVNYDIQQRGIAQSRSHHILQARGQRINSSMHSASSLSSTDQSADSHLQAIVAGYTRATLDRGGWHNAFAPADHYAAGEPLLAADVGSGVTSPGADDLPQHPRIAAR
jgi:hypothetical protein